MASGRLAARIVDGDLRDVRFAGHEVLRRVSYPVRDADWATCPVVTQSETLDAHVYTHGFADRAAAFSGLFRAEAFSETLLVLKVEFRFRRAMTINRAGFALLHPITGVAGTAMRIVHPDGRASEGRFPLLVTPGQPARNIAGLTHQVGPVAVDIAFSGEVFEMEDQRNWSDASFKTYCRPLSLPRPFLVAEGTVLTQQVVLRLVGGDAAQAPRPARMQGTARLPQVMLAHQPGLSTTAALAGFPGVPVLLRLEDTTPDTDLDALSLRSDVAVEIAFKDLPDLDRQIVRLERAGLRPIRVAALPVAYLASHQPEGPWPDGPAPRDALAPLRKAFPSTAIGSGSLTNFTEFNRCRPDPSSDFMTFGNTAIVHAADDMSVRETLEALPAILATAAAIAPGKPMHLGLFSIGMRSNPYGRDVVANPSGVRLAMAMCDPRQTQGFAAAYAVGVLAAAARAGAASLALAMPDGPLGADGTPLADVIRAAARLAGQPVQWIQDGALHVLRAEGVALAAAVGPVDAPWDAAPGGRVAADTALVTGAAA